MVITNYQPAITTLTVVSGQRTVSYDARLAIRLMVSNTHRTAIARFAMVITIVMVTGMIIPIVTAIYVLFEQLLVLPLITHKTD